MSRSTLHPLHDAGKFSVRLNAANLERFEGLREAVAGFDAGDKPAAMAAVGWLQSIDVNAVQESVTHLCFVDGHLVGFYALASGQAVLTTKRRAEVGVRLRTQPAVILTWVAKSAQHQFDGSQLIEDAVFEALKAAEHVAATVLALDPFDAETAEMWRARYGFVDSAENGPGRDLPRLVIPLRRSA